MRIDIAVNKYGKLPETGEKAKSFKNKSKPGMFQYFIGLKFSQLSI